MNWGRRNFLHAVQVRPWLPVIEMIIYIHIPKCAGNTMREFWRQNYDTAWFFGRQVDRKQALLMHELKMGREVIGGHMPYGAHQFLGPCEYVTMLRHPVDRVLSHYYSLKEANPEILKPPLLEYLERPDEKRIFPRNSQTLLLSGGSGSLVVAIDNLKRNIVFGLTDYFDLSLKRIAKVFDCKVTIDTDIKINKTSSRPKVGEIQDSVYDEIADQENKDIALYEWAYDNFTF